jgi:hypothetical protein
MLIIKKIKFSIFSLIIILSYSCSDGNSSSKEKHEGNKILDSLAIEKNIKSNEIIKLNSELDSLRMLRDSLNRLEIKSQ